MNASYQTANSQNQIKDDGYSAQGGATEHEKRLSLERLLAGRYQIDTQMGLLGNMYRGLRKSDGKQIVIKQMRLDTAGSWQNYEVFEREAKILSALHVPGTAQFYEWIQTKDGDVPISLIVQEYIDGRPLQTFLDKGSRFHFTVTCKILIQIIDIIKAMHTHQPPVIHRDIKPSHILLRFDEDKYSQIPQAFLVDFGTAATPQNSGVMVSGTYGYMAPETLAGKTVAASDIYSFAVIAVYMMSGVPPEKMEVDNLKLLIDKYLDHLPDTVSVFLRQMLETDPEKRLTDYDKIRSVLEMFASQNFMIEFLDSASHQNSSYRLENVESLMQPGNISLWQSLPDKTPRRVPQIYRQMIARDAKQCASLASEEKISKELPAVHVNIASRHFKVSSHSKKTAHLGMMLTYTLGLILVGLIFAVSLSYSSVMAPENHIYGMILMAVYLILMIISLIGIIRHAAQAYEKSNRYQPLLEKTLKNGRKSLATIENIQLLSSAKAFDKSFGLDNIVSDAGADVAKINAIFNTQIRPLWRISYTFQVPELKDAGPVVHAYYSETYMDKSKIGESLPILYDIEDNKVYSMPYPIPADSSILQCRDLVSHFNIKLRSMVYKF